MKKADIIITALLIVVVAGFAVYLNSNLGTTYETMELIQSRYKGGRFVDYDRTICVESPEDLGWWKEREDWYVQYGKLCLKFTPKDLKDPKFMTMVNAIGLEIKGDVDEGHLRFFWQETELKELVP